VPRPIILGVVGDSAAGKTTITRGLVRILGEDQVTHVGLDDYHRYDRNQRAANGITPLRPDANYMDIMTQHLRLLRAGEPILKPVYRHNDGTFGPAIYVEPHGFAVLEGLLGYHTDELCNLYDVRVYLAPPEALRRKWKVDRDCSRRGYTTDEVLAELDRREPDSAAFIRPQQRRADMVVSFQPAANGSGALDADLLLRPDLPHPDLSPFVGSARGITVEERGAERRVRIPADVDPEDAAGIEEAVWEKMHFARHLRTEHLGEYTVGTELHRSETLAIVQVLVLYHLVTAKATVALGGHGTRTLPVVDVGALAS
jgi:phosphoribulokinase